MAGADIGSTGGKRGKIRAGPRRPKRRLGIRIDMTPMVDIAFLLLIFYMVTTVFSMPQAMEVNLPPESKEDLEVNKLLTIRVDGYNQFFWNMGKDSPVPMKTDSLRTLLVDKNMLYPRLNTLIIIHKKARYRAMVDILDEIDLIERSFNSAIAEQYGISLAEFLNPSEISYEEFKKKRFSYRYAMTPWDDGDTRRIEKAMSNERREP